MIKRVCPTFFSGTGTSKKIAMTVAKRICEKLEIGRPVVYDFTPLKSREKPLKFIQGDLVVFAVPVIAGRVPNLLLPFLNSLEGSGAYAVPVVLYGNRHYDDALVELEDILKTSGMVVIAGAAFIGEHSFSKKLAAGRPDESDLALAIEFAEVISKKIIEGKLRPLAKSVLPGVRPYRFYYQPRDRHGNPIDIRKVKPKTNNNCTDCKLCARICPLGSIDFADTSKIPGICMKCCACVKLCPKQAKYFGDPGYIFHKEELEELYERRASPEYWV